MFNKLYNVIRRAYYVIGISAWIAAIYILFNELGFLWQFRSWDNFLLSCLLFIGPMIVHYALRYIITGKQPGE